MKEYKFEKAVPVWERGKECEKNYNLVFRSVIGKFESACIRLSASNVYQLFVNGNMIAHGPARSGHGYFRVDEIDISKYLDREMNVIAVFVNQYYVQNYYLIRQDAFLCAEIIADGDIIAATGYDGFDATYNSQRVRKVARYSGQRTFTEAYNYDSGVSQILCEPGEHRHKLPDFMEFLDFMDRSREELPLAEHLKTNPYRDIEKNFDW